jgi:uncharacterized RDD family membrane protein YckC
VSVGLVRCRRCSKAFCRNCVVALRAQYYCARCKADQVRDIQSGTEAGVLELATLGRRFGAQWLDGMLLGIVFVPIWFFLAGSEAMSAAATPGAAPPDMLGVSILATIGMVLVVLIYEGLMLSNRGQTLGKMAVGIKVVTPEGRDIRPGQAWGRAAVRQVFFSYLGLINLLPAVFTKQKTAIHDLAAKTRVVRCRR